MTHICIFTITKYGISGNELPPPPIDSFSRAIVASAGATKETFVQEMQQTGMQIRWLLKERWEKNASQYSQPDSCSWTFVETGILADLLNWKEKET
jgi:hypothetical protein